MTMGIMFMLFVFVVRLSTCHNVNVEFSKKLVSDRKGDGFGYSLATSQHKLVIGAPFADLWSTTDYPGSVMVDESVRVKGPEGGKGFGGCVDVNQHFMVVSGFEPSSVYVYKSDSPHNMVARFPMDSYVYFLVISDDDTIAVSHRDNNRDYWLTIYQYDGSSTWHVAKKFKLENIGYSPAMYGDILVVGDPLASLVHIFNRAGGEWVQGQAIKQQQVEFFGLSVALYGQHMAVSSDDSIVFTYMLDRRSNTWINNGKHPVPDGISNLSIQNEVMVATLEGHPDVCGVVYSS